MERPVVSAVWTIHAAELPRVPRRCPRCDDRRPFRSSGKFRVNAQKRRLDIWLVHRCEVCDETWNAPVGERLLPQEVGADLVRYERNDPDLAWQLAFAVPGADRAVAWTVARPPLEPGLLSLKLVLADPVSLRLDRLLARELDVPRAALRDLRGRVADGQTVVVTSHRREDPAGRDPSSESPHGGAISACSSRSRW